MEDGLLEHEGYGQTSGYCVDHMVGEAGEVQSLVLKCHGGGGGEGEGCEGEGSSTLLIVFTVLGGVSLLFLLVTLVVYLTVPELSNRHGKIVVGMLGLLLGILLALQ